MVTSCNPYSRVEFHSEDSDQMKLSTAATTAAAGRNSRSPMRQTSTEPTRAKSAGVALSTNGDCPKTRKFSARTYGSTPPQLWPQ